MRVAVGQVVERAAARLALQVVRGIQPVVLRVRVRVRVPQVPQVRAVARPVAGARPAAD